MLMKNYYDLLGLKPGCTKKELKKAYRAALEQLETGDLIGEEELTQAYRFINAARKHQRPERKKYGFWKMSKEFRAHFTGPRGSEAARSVIRRFGIKELFTAVGIIVFSWLVYLLLSAVMPNLFSDSRYPLLALDFSKKLVSASAKLLVYGICIVIYVCRSLRRRTNGLRKLNLGFLAGCVLLVLGLFIPQNQLSNTASLLLDIGPLQQEQFSVTKNILLEDAFLQTNNLFGDLYTYKSGKSNRVYIPKSLLEDADGTVHQAVVTFLPHTHAAAKVQVRAMENHLYGSIGDCFFLDLPNESDAQEIYLRRSSATLVMEQGSAQAPVQTDLRTVKLKNEEGQPLVETVTSDKMAALALSQHRLFLCFTAEDSVGTHTCVAVIIDRESGKILKSWELQGQFVYRVFSCANRDYVFTQALVKDSFTERTYSMQIFDPAAADFVYTAPENYILGSAPHIASFAENGVWISKHTNGENPIGKFTVPESLMK